MQEDALEGTAGTGHNDAPVSETYMVQTFLTMSESREGLSVGSAGSLQQDPALACPGRVMPCR